MSRIVVLAIVASLAAVSCGGGSGDDENQITRIDGPAVVDRDQLDGPGTTSDTQSDD